MDRPDDSAFWHLEQAEWLYDEIVYRTHMRTRNRVMLACLVPAAWGALSGTGPAFGPLGLCLVMAYVWIVWSVVYERQVALFLPVKAACYLMIANAHTPQTDTSS